MIESLVRKANGIRLYSIKWIILSDNWAKRFIRPASARYASKKNNTNGRAQRCIILLLASMCHVAAWDRLESSCSSGTRRALKFFYLLNHTGENRRFDRCIVDWTNQCKSHLPLVAKSAFLQTATAANISGPIYETFLCSGSLAALAT